MQDDLARIEQFISQGQGALARDEIRRLAASRPERRFIGPLAALARRADLPSLALKLLGPFVRPPETQPVEALPIEKCEYAASLIRVGASEEALTILGTIPGDEYPAALLFLSHAYMAQWNYRATFPLLRRYIASSQLSDYQKLVGKVNLAAGLIFEEAFSEANELLSELLEETRRSNAHLLHGNSLELSAANAIYQRDWARAAAFIGLAHKALAEVGEIQAFFVHKWERILVFLRSDGEKSSAAELKKLRKEASERRHWESVRDIDRFIWQVTRDPWLLARLYYGTPLESFRRKLLKAKDPHEKLPAQFLLAADGRKTADDILDIVEGRLVRGTAKLKPGQSVHRLLVTLCSDFYRPFRIAQLFSKIFPGEYFNPSTSPQRVHQAIDRLRAWFAEEGSSLGVQEDHRWYRLSIPPGTAIRLHLSLTDHPNAESAPLLRLKQTFSTREFSAVEVGETLEISHRSALRVLRQAMDSGAVVKVGGGYASRYRFVA